MVNVGLVVEGPHDVIMLSPIIAYEFKKRRNEEVNFIPIQPTQDASGAYGHGGWTKVMAWCLANSGANLQSQFEPLFAGDPRLDLIVIHLDGDALDLVRGCVPSPLPPSNASVPDRMVGLEAAVASWLQPSEESRKRLLMAFPTMQTECWILAAEGHVQTSEHVNAKDIFRANHRPDRSVTPLYRKRVRDAAPGFGNIGQICQSYGHFEAGLAAIEW